MKLTEMKHLAIIEAAKIEFIEHGFLTANMERISQSAEVSKRTLYRHFESKEVLFVAVLSLIQQQVSEEHCYQYNANENLHTQLTHIIEKEINIIYNNYGIDLCRTIVMEFLRQPELAKNVVQQLYSTRSITAWMKEAQMDKRLKNDDLATMTLVFSSLFQGFLFWPQLMELNNPYHDDGLKQRIDTVVSVFLSHFGTTKN